MWPFKRSIRFKRLPKETIPEEFFHGKSKEEAREKLIQLQKEVQEKLHEELTSLKEEEQHITNFVLEFHFFINKRNAFFENPTKNNRDLLEEAVTNLEKGIKKIEHKDIKLGHLIHVSRLSVKSMKSLIKKFT